MTAVLYLTLVVKEPISKKVLNEEPRADSNPNKSAIPSNSLYTFFITPLVDMKDLIRKKRTIILTSLIVIQLINYCTYIFALNSSMSLLYLYMLIQFDGFVAADYAYFSVTMNVCSIFCLIVLMPIVSGKFHASDSLLLAIISVTETLGYILSPFTSNLKLFYFFQILCTIGNCKFPIGRSLLSKYCEPDEVGKMYSIQSILISLSFMVSNPIVRKLYSETIENFPGAFLLLNASILFLSGFGNIFIYLNRKQVELKPGSGIFQKEYNEM